MTFHSPKPSWRELFDMGLYATEAARLRGVTVDAARAWAERNKARWPDGRTLKFGAQLDRACPCIVRGKSYPSIAAAERDLGLKSGAITYHLNKYGHAEYAGLKGRLGTRNYKTPANAKPINIGGVAYTSLSAAATDLRLGRNCLRKWNAGCLPPRAEYKILKAVLQRDARIASDRMKGMAV